MLDVIDSTLVGLGVRDLQVAVVATNADAIRLYRRRGLTPRLTVLSNYAQDRRDLGTDNGAEVRTGLASQGPGV